jgi:hypothetical protein
MREEYEKLGWRIFQFRDDEIVYKPKIVKSIVDGMMGRHSKIGARKCTIRKVVAKDAYTFFEENHLMGAYGASKTWGLYFRNKLVCAISVRKRGTGLEIARFGSMLDTRVVGGFSKLLKHITELYDPDFIVSFCDLRYGNGDVYRKAGFTLESITLGWQWTDFDKTYNRLSCRANMDSRRLSEAEYAKELRISKIYDAGQAKFVLTLKRQ